MSPLTPGKLTEPAFWSKPHERESLRARCLSVLERPGLRWLGPYAEHLLWDVLLKPCHAREPGARAIEIGCAPGGNVVRLQRDLGYEAYGVEYVPAGAERARHALARAGLDPVRIILADFLDDSFLSAHRERYDLVFSMGFVEHFTDPARIVALHAMLLRPGGWLIVGIPNLSGWNRRLQELADPAVLAAHHLEIMDLEIFRALFSPEQLSIHLCRYAGTLHLGLAQTRRGGLRRILVDAANLVQIVLNPVLRAILGDRGGEHRALSPYILYVGRKR